MQRFDITEFVQTKHGRIAILREVKPQKGARMLLCQCDSGTVWKVSLRYIKTGQIKSCGCYREDLKKAPKKHGMSGRYNKATEYKIWAKMIQRCTNSNEKDYIHYGGRGITVCEDWRQFENFLRDMGQRPTNDHTLERNDVNGNYEPSNCKWATKLEQANNKRNNRRFECQGKNLTIAQWAKETGINISTLKYRMKNPNWTIEQALTQSIR